MNLKQVCCDYFSIEMAHELTGIAYNSKDVRPGMIFIAFLGQSHDGHDFINEAVSAGAKLVLGTKKLFFSSVVYVQVADVQQTIYDLARLYRRSLPKVIAITGSVGKTSTKDILSRLISTTFSVKSTVENHNNELGLPLTILNCPTGCEVLILEMGSRRVGDIAYLMDCALPDISIITRITESHLASFGSIDVISQAKSEIIKRCRPGDIACFQEEEYKQYGWHTERAILSVNKTIVKDGYYTYQEIKPGSYELTMYINGHYTQWRVSILGEHMIDNVAKCIRVALACGVRPKEIAKALLHHSPSPGRMELVQGVYTIIDDTYNAAPLSVELGLNTLAKYSSPSAFLFGQMAECGVDEMALHQQILRHAHKQGIDLILGFGELFKEKPLSDLCHETNLSDKELKNLLQSNKITHIYVKGSRSMRMEHYTKILNETCDV